MFKNRWWIVFASVLGMIVGNAVVNVFAAGVFLKPLAKDLGFGRGVISTAILVANWVTALAVPFVGRLIDRYGVRAVLLPAAILFALATASRAFLTSSALLLMVIFGLSGLVGSGQTTTGYSKMIVARFDTQRGLALGVALAGVGLGTFIVPLYSDFLLRHFGWRIGFVGIGVAVIVLAFIPVAIFFKEPVATSPLKKAAGQAAPPAVPGLKLAEAMRTWSLWAMMLVFFLSTVAINGVLIHSVALLTDRGISPVAATAALSFSGLALIVGRLISGYLMDKIFAPYIGMFFMVCAIVGMGILGLGFKGAGPMVGTILLGVGMGAEIDMLAFLIGSYFGIREFGSIHGCIYMSVLIANGVGAAILGWCFQLTKSYNFGLVLFEILLVICLILYATMGPYRYAPRKKPEPAGKEEPALAQ